MRENNFDLMRLIAALMVIYSHSYALNGLREPLLKSTFGQFTLGYLGVLIFFTISGFLIFDSCLRRKDLTLFARARILRILPALIALILICTFIIGPITTTLPIHEYFKDKMTMEFLFNLFPNSFTYFLPEIFSTNLSPAIVPHLWSVKFEIVCYIWVMIFNVFGVLQKRKFLVFLLILASIYILYSLVRYAGDHQYSRYCAVAFLSSGTFRLYWDQVPRNFMFALISLLGLFATNYLKILALGWILFGVYIVLFLATNMRIKTWKIMGFGDISYGLYLWGFVIQQCVVFYFGGKMDPLLNFIVSLSITVPIAYFSWKLIEEPALKYK